MSSKHLLVTNCLIVPAYLVTIVVSLIQHIATMSVLIIAKNSWVLNTTWQLIGGVRDGNVIDGSAAQSVDKIGAQHYFNTSLTYDFADSFAMTFGVQNLLDNKPPVIGDNDEQANTYPSSYDVFGRAFFANAKVRF